MPTAAASGPMQLSLNSFSCRIWTFEINTGSGSEEEEKGEGGVEDNISTSVFEHIFTKRWCARTRGARASTRGCMPRTYCKWECAREMNWCVLSLFHVHERFLLEYERAVRQYHTLFWLVLRLWMRLLRWGCRRAGDGCCGCCR